MLTAKKVISCFIRKYCKVNRKLSHFRHNSSYMPEEKTFEFSFLRTRTLSLFNIWPIHSFFWRRNNSYEIVSSVDEYVFTDNTNTALSWTHNYWGLSSKAEQICCDKRSTWFINVLESYGQRRWRRPDILRHWTRSRLRKNILTKACNKVNITLQTATGSWHGIGLSLF